MTACPEAESSAMDETDKYDSPAKHMNAFNNHSLWWRSKCRSPVSQTTEKVKALCYYNSKKDDQLVLHT
jgi:hypothetical protein